MEKWVREFAAFPFQTNSVLVGTEKIPLKERTFYTLYDGPNWPSVTCFTDRDNCDPSTDSRYHRTMFHKRSGLPAFLNARTLTIAIYRYVMPLVFAATGGVAAYYLFIADTP